MTLNLAAVVEDISHLMPNQQNVLAAFCKAQAEATLHTSAVEKLLKQQAEIEAHLAEAQKHHAAAKKRLEDASKRMETVFGFGDGK